MISIYFKISPISEFIIGIISSLIFIASFILFNVIKNNDGAGWSLIFLLISMLVIWDAIIACRDTINSSQSNEEI